jgi:hypothetical protein
MELLTGLLVPVLPSVAAAVASSLFPRAVPALRTGAVHGPGCPHEKTLPAPGSEGFGGHSPMSRGAIERPHPSSLWPDTAVPKRIAWHGRGQSRPRGSARCRPIRLVAFVSASRLRLLAEAEGLEPPWTRFWRPPLSPLSYTSSANQQKSRLGRSRAACLSGACGSSFQDVDKRTSPPVKAQEIPLRSQYWLRSLASDGLCITIIMGPSFYARRRAKSIGINVNNRFIVAFTPRPRPSRH